MGLFLPNEVKYLSSWCIIQLSLSSDERKYCPYFLDLNFFEKKAKEGVSPVNFFLNRLGGLNMGSFPIILRFDSLGWYF
jgi:hypothetical protein